MAVEVTLTLRREGGREGEGERGGRGAERQREGGREGGSEKEGGKGMERDLSHP
jgi:hypothetical protein